MCGIVGLLVKNTELRSRLGELMVPMLVGMSERGPEAAGMAVFTEPLNSANRKYSVYSPDPAFSWLELEAKLRSHLGTPVAVSAQFNHAIVTSHLEPAEIRAWLKEHFPALRVLSAGHSIDVYKDVGSPAQVAGRYHFKEMKGTHLVGHTRLATESAVTPDRAHPFTAGEDFCLVHNGTISNAHMIRRKLERFGVTFETDNDTEAACRFLEWRMREGDSLKEALEKAFDELDGFYTLLMGTKNELALVRDAFSCKPAVVAETDDYVAIASEFRSLAHLPNVQNARIFEPNPEEIYLWQH